MNNQNTFLFEVSWEVCNKVGGIHTVVKSKIHEAIKKFGENYCLIGPLFDHNPEFIDDRNSPLTQVTDALLKEGIKTAVGYWNIPEKPPVILVKYTDTIDQSRLLYQLWKDFGVDSMTGGWDYQEPVLFATIAAKVIETASSIRNDTTFLAHFHEWTSGAGLLHLKKHAPTVATIYTAHSTVVGHKICEQGANLYQLLGKINADKEAAKQMVTAKHSLETASAREADLFTTISDITAIEAKNMLGVETGTILHNGLNINRINSEITPEYRSESRRKLIEFASNFLKKKIENDTTVIISTSGRYEYLNKGLDIFLSTMSELKRKKITGKNIIAFCFTMAGAKPPNDSFRSEKYSSISTHPLWDASADPFIATASRLGLDNTEKESPVNLILVPAQLNGNDGVLNMEYLEALSGCDLTVYPSFYEPWGYTPLESAAFAIPTVSTDIAGFGRWVKSMYPDNESIKIVNRESVDMAETVKELTTHILKVISLDKESMEKLRNGALQIARGASWENLFKNYAKAYDTALVKAKTRIQRSTATEATRDTKNISSFRGTNSSRPRFKQFSVITSLPKKLERLRELAHNIWWVWNADATELFVRLDPILFEKISSNPVALLEIIDPAKLELVSKNESYMLLYESVMQKFDKYMSMKGSLIKELDPVSPKHPIAYFSMEFGLHECLPLYSGGLGILSGDHMKSTSDVNLPLFGVGLLYKNGYFKQSISKDGTQKVDYFHNDFFRMPLTEVTKNSERLTIGINFPGRTVYARIWKALVGRTEIYFLDTDIQENNGSDREITSKLYGGDKRTRIEQEIILGIGGVRLIDELELTPSVYHLNEGHSAFLILERLMHLVKKVGLDFKAAGEIIKGSTVFTTHTPVPAGNETFDISLVENYLRYYIENNGLSWQEFSDAGHKKAGDHGPFEMTVFALKYTNKRNGVSRLHKLVSKEMWQELWSGFLIQEVPIDHITNGVHPGTWLTSEIHNLLLKYASVDMHEDLLKIWSWDKAMKIPDEQLWQAHLFLKTKLYNTIKERITANWTREGEDPTTLDRFLMKFSPNALTIGFARRFATYKRATLFMKNLDRIRNILSNKKYPVQFIIAGKAHPADKIGADLIRDIAQMCKQDEYLGQIVFVENYDMTLARRLISGADVWLNNPRRPLEASGTSGQKAGMNGVINCSVLDGWWDEGYNGQNGWAIGERKEYLNTDMQDIIDSDSLYDILENELIPSYYQRNMGGIPEKWVRMMKQSIISTISEFNTHRMLKDYAKKMYVPTAKKHFALTANHYELARKLSQQKTAMNAKFPGVHIKNVQISGIHGDNLAVNDEISFFIEANIGQLSKDEVTAEMVLIQDKGDPDISFSHLEKLHNDKIKYIPLSPIEQNGSEIKYGATYKAAEAGKFNYGARIRPAGNDIEDIIDMNLVYWA